LHDGRVTEPVRISSSGVFYLHARAVVLFAHVGFNKGARCLLVIVEIIEEVAGEVYSEIIVPFIVGGICDCTAHGPEGIVFTGCCSIGARFAILVYLHIGSNCHRHEQSTDQQKSKEEDKGCEAIERNRAAGLCPGIQITEKGC
jgi:hypothetical protein